MSKTNRPKSGTVRRREELRRIVPKQTFDPRVLLQQPELINAALVALGFMIVTSLIVIWARGQIKVEPDQIMTDTRLKRLDYRVPDIETTDAKRETARESAPQVYTLNDSYLEGLAASLNALPKAVAGKATIAEISEQLRQEFQLTDKALIALAPWVVDGETTNQWKAWVENLTRRELPRNPFMEKDEYQNHWLAREYAPTLKRVLRLPSGAHEDIPGDTRAIELLEGETPPLRRLEQVVRLARFPSDVVPYLMAKLGAEPRPVLSFDQAETASLAEQAAAAVQVVFDVHNQGEVLYREGETLSAKQYEDLLTEAEVFAATAPFAQRWLPRLAVVGILAVVAGFLIGYIFLFYPRIARNYLRLIAICALLAGMLGLTASTGVRAPTLIYLGAVAPTVFVAMVALLAYDQRIALFLGAIQCALVGLALGQGIGMFILLFTGCGVAVAQLREMRHRSTLIQASAITGVVLMAGAILVGLLETPLVAGAWSLIVFQSFLAGFGGFAVGFVVLGILPSLERWFDITTGMTLAELRDPKQPLLKQLQQKAPGTYNHSLQVANIAEAAAEAIGANGLLVYVGALYHDIGKMNKPEYFIENLTDGASKHAKLSPAMSLLVIVGHVKDGIELAREYGLPRAIQHAIESHHGTTLVEYFYHAAKSLAESDDRSSVEEIEFRYPGPKPRTKEAAILMLSDAVESATRSMAEPNPSRIGNLVRQLSRKRLADGQYDQSDLTFRELSLIEESMIKSLCAIYHGRISYPSQQKLLGAEPATETVPKPLSA